ncbi:MAG TPA: NAD(P)/FAD-dependent oxidoreductase, partial [Alphaproteobacteria bacterium]|nr:NAD(P)/FAD-dependent oxidoreductase [Alphaproteobacteria bacterium]
RRVYAIGEAAGGAASGPTAAFEARLVVRSALLGIPARPARHTLPRIVQTDPELAETGLTEPEARARHQDRFTILRASFADNDRARATRATYGLAKLIIAPGGRILGAGVVGERAGELAALFSLAIANRLDMRSLARFEPPHPTFAAVARTLGTEYLRSRGVATLVQRLVALVRLTP